MKIVVTGAKGQVGSEVVSQLTAEGYDVVALTRQTCDLSRLESIKPTLAAIKPGYLVNCAAYTAVDKAEEEPEQARLINQLAVEQIAQFCNERKIPLLHLSTDYVFDGEQQQPYQEEDLPGPQGIYAQTKWEGEQAIQSCHPEAIILRVSWIFGTNGNNFVKTILKLAKEREELGIVADQYGCPTAAKDIARVVSDLVNKYKAGQANWGIYHYAAHPATTWYDFAKSFTELAKSQGKPLALETIKPLTTADYPTKAKRPQNSALATHKLQALGIAVHDWSQYLPEVIDSVYSKD